VQAHPVQLVVEDDLRRNRLTVFFRILLAIPHLIWLILWSVVAYIAVIVNWFAALIRGHPPAAFHRFLCSYIRYVAHVSAYLWMVGNPYPGFVGEEGEYPIDLTLPVEPMVQSRWKTLFRAVLVLPAAVLAALLGGSGTVVQRGKHFVFVLPPTGALLLAVAVLGWWVGVFRGRMPKGFRDAGAFSIGYGAQVLAYSAIITDRYPFADPAALLARVEPPPVHPVHLVDTGDLRRSRVTVFFRLALFIPHYVVLEIWGIAVFFSVVVNWFITLFRGTPAGPLHRFNSRFVRYAVHVYAFVLLVANPFPGFTGDPGTYPIDLVLPDAARQNRWKTGFRVVLIFPAYIVGYALGLVLYVTAALNWFVGLICGRSPEGLHKVGVYALRYLAQMYAYAYLLTDAYPNASPLEGAEQAADPEPTAEPQLAG
jgi:Domain of unknown function (DUF4389)